MLLALMLLVLVNDYRAEYDLPPLLPSAHLTEAAQWMAEDMVLTHNWGHTDSLGRDAWERMDDYGYGGSFRGETLACGSLRPEPVLQAKQRSPGHNSILLNVSYTVIGIGQSGTCWVLDFGGCPECPKTYPQWRWP